MTGTGWIPAWINAWITPWISGRLLSLDPWQPVSGNGGTTLILLLALLLDALLGGRSSLGGPFPHPVRLIGRAIDLLDRRLNRARHSPAGRRWRGLVTAAGLTALAVLIGWLIGALRRTWRWGWLIELLLVTTMLAQRSLFVHVRAVARALQADGLAGGRRAVALIVGRDPASLDTFGVARAAIECCAESFADGIVAPVLWYLAGGLPGLLALKTVNTMDSMIGHKSEHYRDFGMVAARTDDLMMFLPARVAGVLLCAAACFAPRGRPWRALRIMWRDHRRHDSPNAGWPEAAMAGAFDLALSGPRRYGGETVNKGWIGDGRARATAADIVSALYLLALACFLEAGLIVLLLVAQS